MSDEPSPSTTTHGAWLRAAMELESCADQMLERAAELRGRASRSLAELAERGVPLRRRDDDYTPAWLRRRVRQERLAALLVPGSLGTSVGTSVGTSRPRGHILGTE